MAIDETKGPEPQGDSTPVLPQGSDSTHVEETHVSHEQHVDDPYHQYDDPYADNSYTAPSASTPTQAVSTLVPSGATPPPPTATPKKEEADDDDEGMLRMSFMDHLEELRSRIIRSLYGIAIAFALSLIYADKLWNFVQGPASYALTKLGYPPDLVQISPMDTFSVVWVKIPMLLSLFIASPWVLWQVWGFIAPGLYKNEKRMAAPFILVSAGLFILGGLFAYFVAFRFGLEFLLGIGKDLHIKPQISIVDYSDLFFNVILGVSLVFELPVVIFFLSLLRIVSAKFLLQHSRYAILLIVILAAVVTPTPDVFNLMLFAVPMVLLYFVGVFAAYLLEYQRDHNRFPWMAILVVAGSILTIAAGIVYLLVAQYGYKLVLYWPFLLQ